MPPIPEAAQIAAWLGCVAFLVALANQALRLMDRMKAAAAPVPDPAATYMPRSESLLHQRSIEDRLSRVEHQIEAARSQREEDNVRIYGALDDVKASLASLTTASEHSQVQMAQVVDRVDRLISQLPAAAR